MCKILHTLIMSNILRKIYNDIATICNKEHNDISIELKNITINEQNNKKTVIRYDQIPWTNLSKSDKKNKIQEYLKKNKVKGNIIKFKFSNINYNMKTGTITDLKHTLK